MAAVAALANANLALNNAAANAQLTVIPAFSNHPYILRDLY